MFFYGIINKTGENMPRKKPDLLDIEEAKTKLNITLQHSNLSGEKDADVMYGTIRCKKVSVRSILYEMEKNHSAVISKELMYYVAQELSERMMRKLKEGCAVELLDFGTIFPTMKGRIKKGDTPSIIKKHFDIGFTPSKEAKKVIQNYELGSVYKVDTQHYIEYARDIFDRSHPKNVLTKDGYVRLSGKALKLGGDVYGLYAAKIDEKFAENSELPIPDRKYWIKQENIFTNLPSKIEFYLQNLEAGYYVFVLETSLSAGGKPLKESVLVKSGVVCVTDITKL